MEILFDNFIKLVNSHKHEVRKRLGDYLIHREHGVKHPVLDFLYTFYHFRPGLLERYSAGFDTKIILNKAVNVDELPNASLMISDENFIQLDFRQFPFHRVESLDWLIELLEKTQQREPQFGCLGMHEWAMVYKQEDSRRHTQPFRLKPTEIHSFVESRPIRCSHHDAFRFFTDEARPLNRLQPAKLLMPEMEQGGCIHTNMDVYRWSYKFYPWVNSSLILKAFDIAYDARFIDMKASPYDLTHLGIEPIKIETKSGAEEYIIEQKRLFEKAYPIRAELIDTLKKLSETFKAIIGTKNYSSEPGR